MKKAYRNQWLADLRSNEFKQGKGKLVRLGDPEGRVDWRSTENPEQQFHCCMGVFCESARKVDFELNVSTFRDIITYDGEDAFPPERLADEAGMSPIDEGLYSGKGTRWTIEFPQGFGPGRRLQNWPNGISEYVWIPDTESTVSFATMNDSWKLPFSQIADIIEYFIPETPDDEPAQTAEESNQS